MRNGVKLAMDIMYVLSVMFLVMTLIGIGFITVSVLPTRQNKDLYTALDTVFRVYNKRSLKISEMHADQEFIFVKDLLTDLGIDLIPVPAGKHQPHLKWTIRTLKERYHAMYQSLPFKAMPQLIIIKASQQDP